MKPNTNYRCPDLGPVRQMVCIRRAKNLRRRSGFHREQLRKASSRSHQTLLETARSRALPRETCRRHQRRRSRAEPRSNRTRLHEQQGDQNFSRARGSETCSRLEAKIWRALPTQSLAGRATHQGRQTHLRRSGRRIHSTEPDQGALRADPPREIHQLHK